MPEVAVSNPADGMEIRLLTLFCVLYEAACATD